jgi:peptidoglycan/LPS O-acetylase OafA/YrhL
VRDWAGIALSLFLLLAAAAYFLIWGTEAHYPAKAALAAVVGAAGLVTAAKGASEPSAPLNEASGSGKRR